MSDHENIPASLGFGQRLADHGGVVVRADLGDQGVDALRDVGWGFAAGTAVGPDVPVLGQVLGGAQRADRGGGDALVVAVVPFGDQRGDFHGGRGVSVLVRCVGVGVVVGF